MAFSRFAESKESSLSSGNHTVVFEDRYYLKRFLKKTSNFYMYEGIDKAASKYVFIYMKPINTNLSLNKKIKAELRSKISPRLLWEGSYKQNSSTFNVQIHEKYGPSLLTMFEYVKENFSQQDFLLLMYQMLRLVERFSTLGYVFRQLDLENIVFDPKPQKNELYLLNTFPLKKKGDESPILCTKYASRAAHLGLRASQKDDAQSICYILLDIITNGNFLKDTPMGEYELEKGHIDFSKFGKHIPEIFKEFYYYSMTLNYNDEVNFFRWRSEIYNLIPKQILSQPYGWMKNKGSESVNQKNLKKSKKNLDAEELADELYPEDKENLDCLKEKTLVKKKLG